MSLPPDGHRLDQLWKTWCTRGIEQSTGHQIRAASSGLAEMRGARVRMLTPFLSYPRSRDIAIANVPVEDTPVSFALVDLGSERVLVRIRYLGLDLVGRTNNFFVHLVAGLPLDFDAHRALRLWDSPFWRERDELPPDVMELPTVSLAELEAQPGYDLDGPLACSAEHLAFVIQAYLSLGPGQRLYIAGEDETILALVAGLSRAIPAAWSRWLTFSTYAGDPLDPPAITTVVGCWRPPAERAHWDLPAACYAGYGYGLNTFRPGHQSALPPNPYAEYYAKFAAGCLVGWDPASPTAPAPLTTLLARAEQAGVQDVSGLLGIYYFQELVTSGAFTVENAKQLLQHPAARAFIGEKVVQAKILELAQTEVAWWDLPGETPQDWRQGARALHQLAVQPDLAASLRRLADDAVPLAKQTLAKQALTSHDVRQAQRLLEEVVKPVAGQTQAYDDHRRKVLAASPSAGLHWDDRAYVLTVLAQGIFDVGAVRSWLGIALHELDAMLRLANVPLTWREEAALSALKTSALIGKGNVLRDDARKQLIRAYGLAHPVLDGAIGRLAKKPDSLPTVRAILEILSSDHQTRKRTAGLGASLLRGRAKGDPLFDMVLGTLMKWQDDAGRTQIIEAAPEQILVRANRPDGVSDWIDNYLATVPITDLGKSSTKILLKQVVDNNQNSARQQNKATRLHSLASMLESPITARKELQQIGKTLLWLGKQQQDDVVAALGRLLGPDMDSFDEIGRYLVALDRRGEAQANAWLELAHGAAMQGALKCAARIVAYALRQERTPTYALNALAGRLATWGRARYEPLDQIFFADQYYGELVAQRWMMVVEAARLPLGRFGSQVGGEHAWGAGR